MKGLYHLSELDTRTIDALVARALELRAGSAAKRFPGRALGLLFMSPSLRTQASCQRAAGKLGLDLVQLAGGGGAQGVWGLETRDGVAMEGACAEHVREAAGVLSRYVDILGIRAFAGMQDLGADRADALMLGFQTHARIPVVNLESAQYHPCQALADWATLEQLGVPRRGKLVLTWARHPKPLPHAVPNSVLAMAAQRGMETVLLRPEGYDLSPATIAEATQLSEEAGGSLTVTDRHESLRGADVVYAKSWGSLRHWGDPAAEAAARAGLREWCVDGRWMRDAGPRARFFHCLPVRRNVVVADEVLDGPASAVLEQAENRLHVQTALLESLLLESPL